MRQSDFYPLKPITVDKDTWLYVERRGLTVVRQVKRTSDGELVKCDLFIVPWSKALKAFEKYKRAKRATKARIRRVKRKRKTVNA